MSMRPIGFASLRDTSHCNKKIKKLPGLDRGGGCPQIGRFSTHPQRSHLPSNVFKYNLVKTIS